MSLPSVPSTSMEMPLAMNLFLISWPSSAIIPSFRAMVASSANWTMSSSGLSGYPPKVFPMTFAKPKNSGSVERYNVAIIEPPKTMRIDAVSTNGPGSPIAITMRAIAPIKPTTAAISIEYSVRSFQALRQDTKVIGNNVEIFIPLNVFARSSDIVWN